jgi:serine protease Do
VSGAHLLFAVAAWVQAAHQQPGGTIAVGQTIHGALRHGDVVSRDKSYVQQWEIVAAQGAVVTIDLASDSFDAYLIVYGPGLANDLQDDDSGGNCNARITVRFPQRGVYHIAVTSTEQRQAGSYSLSVASGSMPKALMRCRHH